MPVAELNPGSHWGVELATGQLQPALDHLSTTLTLRSAHAL